MIKSKSKTFITLLLLLIIILFILNPSICMQATLNGLKVWLINIVPALLPFFIITRIIIALNQNSITPIDKLTYKCFHTKNAGLIYSLSLLSGYPVGAKLISNYYEMGIIDKPTATKMFSFCSTSGPMFIVGTVGIGVFANAKIGYILLLGHIVGSFLNGLIYRGKISVVAQSCAPPPSKNALSDSMYDSIISILLVGGYIVLAFVIIEILKLTNILPLISTLICKLPLNLDYDIVISFLSGLIEMTNGLISLNATNISLPLQVVLSSILIAFSGVCIMMQSDAFLQKIGIKKRTMLLQKLTQALLTALVSLVIVWIIF